MQGWGGRVSASPLWDRLRERGCGWALTPLPGLRSIQGSRPGLSAASPDWAAFSFSDPRWDPGDLVGGWMVSGQAQSSGRSGSGACCPVRVPEAWPGRVSHARGRDASALPPLRAVRCAQWCDCGLRD